MKARDSFRSSPIARRAFRGAVAVVLLAALTVAGTAAGRKFYDDDPIGREPETQDASGAKPFDIGLIYDLTYNLFVTARQPPQNVRARNVNTIDEVPSAAGRGQRGDQEKLYKEAMETRYDRWLNQDLRSRYHVEIFL